MMAVGCADLAQEMFATSRAATKRKRQTMAMIAKA
jgi:hypothetical protein